MGSVTAKMWVSMNKQPHELFQMFYIFFYALVSYVTTHQFVLASQFQ